MLTKKDILTIPEAANYCAVDRVTMWRWVKSGLLKVSVTPGRHHRILREDLESFLISNEMYPLATKSFPRNRVLIVDDDIILQKTLSEALSFYKYETETASDGFEAGIKISQFKPDLIILDLIMPGMDGFDVCRYIRNNPMISDIKILILSGYDTRKNREQIMEAGADDILGKPVEEEVLIQRIEKLMGRKRDYLKKVSTASP